LEQVLQLEEVGTDLYRAASPTTSLQQNFGGQVAAQALAAAAATVPGDRMVHSLHAYFLRPGSAGVPTVYRVDRVREGRSFSTRRVTGIQRGEALFSMAASFQRQGQDGPGHAENAPLIPPPDELEPARWEEDSEFQNIHLKEWPDWELRRVTVPDRVGDKGPVQQVWLRHTAALPRDPLLHACALTYASDMTLLGCSVGPYVARGERLQTASLDHAVWFLQSFRADDWLLYDQVSPWAGAGRGLNVGRIFNRQGLLVAHVVQEGLQRAAAR
jgi:acyl-CoA thioesterase-2